MTHLTNKKTKPVLIFTILMMSIFSLSSCSDSDESVVSKSGEEIASRFKSLLSGAVGETWMIPVENSENKYMAVASDNESAHKLCAAIIGDGEWTATNKVYPLPDQYGSITMIDSEIEGIFLTMSFNIKDMKEIDIDIVSQAYLNNCNIPWYYDWINSLVSCADCGWSTIDSDWPGECPVCGCTQYNKHHHK